MGVHTPAALHRRRRLAVEARYLHAIRWGLRAAVAVVVVGGLALWSRLDTEQIRQVQIEACHRGNLLRAEVSRDQVILGAFLEQAALARERSATAGPPTLRVGNADTATEYRELRAKLRPIPLIDCDRVVRG